MTGLTLTAAKRFASKPFASARPIARWSDAPYQRLTGPTTIGLVAFHPNGIERVEFFVNGISTAIVKVEALNTRYAGNRPLIGNGTPYGAYPGELEYFFTLTPPADTGVVVSLLVEAIVYPLVGLPRFLFGTPAKYANTTAQAPRGFQLYSGGAALIPATITLSDPNVAVNQAALTAALDTAVAGQRIKIMTPGMYTWHNISRTFRDNTHWIIIEGGVPGVEMASADQLVSSTINGNISRLKFENINFRTEKFSLAQGSASRDEWWLENSSFKEEVLDITGGPGIREPFVGNLFITNSFVDNAGYGFVASLLNRNVVQRNAVDFHQNNACSLNCIIVDFQLDAELTLTLNHHADGYQAFGSYACVFIRDFVSLNVMNGVQPVFICQEIGVVNANGSYSFPQGFGWGMDGFCMINCHLICADPSEPAYSQMQGVLRDVYFVNCEFNGQFSFANAVRTGVTSAPKMSNFLMRNVCTYEKNFGWDQARVRSLDLAGVTAEPSPSIPPGQTAPQYFGGQVPFLEKIIGVDGKTLRDYISVRLPYFVLAHRPTSYQFQWARSTDGGATYTDIVRLYSNDFVIRRLPKSAIWRICEEDKASANVRLRCTCRFINRAGTTTHVLFWNPN